MPSERMPGKERLIQLIGNHPASSPFVRGIYDAGRLQYVKTRADGRKADVMKNLIGTEHEYAGANIINSLIQHDRKYKRWRVKETNIETAAEKTLTTAKDYYDGFHMAQSVLGQYVAEDRVTLLEKGEKIASVYPMFINGTLRFFKDLSEITHKWKTSNALRRTMLFFNQITK